MDGPPADILPFRLPGPMIITWQEFDLGGRRLQASVQQWPVGGGAGMPAEAEVYPWSDGRPVLIRLYDAETGAIIPAVSAAPAARPGRRSRAPKA